MNKSTNTKRLAILGLAVALLAGVVPAQTAAPMPKEQVWLKQLVGEWTVQYSMYMEPGQPPTRAAGTDTVRGLGDHWIVAETKTTMMDAPFGGILSLGYDAQKKAFNATWIDSMSGHLWVYKGALDTSNDTLTLETEGPSMEGPDKTAKYKEVIRITGTDTRTFTSNVQTADGTWMKILEAQYTRK